MKILIVSETIAGKGHEKAAMAIYQSMKAINKSYDVKIVHLLFIFNQTIEKIINFTYLTIISKVPFIWRYMYTREAKFSALFKNIIAHIMSNKINEYLEAENPDLIIATHASGLRVLSKLKQNHHYHIAAVFTDFQVNSFWIDDQIDYYFVAHEDLKEKMIKTYQIEMQKIFVSGIPINSAFSTIHDIPEKNQRKLFEILIMGGGLGLGGMKNIILALNDLSNLPIHITVVTGMNEKLYGRLHKLKKKLSVQISVLKYTDQIHTIMKNSNLLITKPGGLSISEALACQIPIMIYKVIPGQEEQNLKFLIKNKAVIKVNKVEEIIYWVRYLYHHPKLIEKLKKRERLIAKPNATIDICKTLLFDNKKITVSKSTIEEK